MAPKNPTTNARRFRVETIGHELVIFDTHTITYRTCPPGTSKSDAEQQCAVLNGTINQNRSVERTTLHREFLAKGVTPERLIDWIDPYNEERPPSLRPLNEQDRQRVDNYKDWMPPLLQRWADGIAEQNGYGGKLRSAWSTWSILTMLRSGNFWPDPDGVNFLILPSTGYAGYCTDREAEQREAVALHYLSSDPAHLKAGFLGMSRATYLRAVDAGHRLVARRWLA